MADLILSGSSVKTFLRCARQWYYSYVAGIERPNNLYAIRGTAVHRAVEVNAREKLKTGRDAPLEVMEDAFAESFDSQIAHGYLANENDDPPQRFRSTGLDLVALYREEVAPTLKPILIEHPFQVRINDIAYTGQIDLVTESDHGPVIHDTKTASSAPSGNDHRIALAGYALAARSIFGTSEVDIVLDYLIARKTSVAYLPVSNGGPMTDAQLGAFALVLESVAKQIDAGLFPPTGVTNRACSRCPYNDICPAAHLGG